MQAKIYTLIFKAICFIGCCFQINEILQDYLKYNTTTLIEIQLADNIAAPDVSYCIRVSDVFDYDRYNKLNKVKLPFIEGNALFNTISMTNSVLVKDIYDFTPNSSLLIKSCTIRKYNSYRQEFHDKTTCNRHFSIMQFILDEFICYRFHLRTFENQFFHSKHLIHAMTYTGLFFSIELDTNRLRLANRVRLSAHENDWPDRSIQNTDIVYRLKENAPFEGYF